MIWMQSCKKLVPNGSKDQEQTIHPFTAHKTGEKKLENGITMTEMNKMIC